MKLTLLGGGGFRVPLMFRTLLADQSERRVTELRLWDTDAGRLAVIRSILQAMAQGHPRAPEVRVAQNLEEAVTGTDFVFSAIRVGGTEGRATEETIAHCCGVSGRRPPASVAWTTRCAASPPPSGSPRRSPGWPPAPI